MGGYLTRYLKSPPRSPWTAPRPGCAREPGSASPGPRRCPRDPVLFHPALVFPGFFVLSRTLPPLVPADLPAAQPTGPKQCLWELLKQGRSAPRPGHTKPPGSRRRPGAHSPVTVLIKAPQRPGTRYKCPPVAPTPDPCAKATVLQALSKCTKGKRKLDGPLWFEMLEPEVPEPEVPEVPEPKVPKLEVSEPPKSPEPPKTREPRPSAFVPVISKGVTRPFAPQLGPLSPTLLPGPRRPPQSLPPRRASPVGARCVPWCRHCTGQGHRLAAGDPGATAPQARGLGPGRPAQQPQQRSPPEPRRPFSPMVPLTAPRGPNGRLLFRYRPTVTIVSY